MDSRTSYRAQWTAEAWKTTVLFTRGKLTVSACMALFTRIALWRLHGRPLRWAELGEDLLIIAGCYVVVIVVSFVINFFRAPGVLADRQKQKYAELETENARLRKALAPTAAQERILQLVSDKIKDFTSGMKKVLRCIMDHGTIHSMALEFESGLPYNEVNNAVLHGTARSLILSLADNTLTINSQFKSALDSVLTSEGL